MTPGRLAEGPVTDAAGGCADGPRGGTRPLLPVVAGLVTALGLAWYFTGPPWYLGRTSTPISHQEEVVLIGLQAVAKGHLPYVGVASVQYGPGTQVAAYWLMRHVTSFSVVGFREAWALLVWAGVSVLFAVFFLAFGYARGLAVSALSALVYPALHEVAFQPGGSFDGYFGWASPLRYAGVIALVLLLPAVIGRCPAWRGTAAAAAIGALWGLTSYLAQENLAGGAVGALTAGGLLLFSGSASWRAVRTALAAVLAGFLVIWTPILVYYACHGQLAEFLRQYFLFPKAVASGANDTPWGGFRHTPSPYSPLFYVLPFLLAGLTLLAVVRIRPLRIATQWSGERALFLVTVLATALLYEGVLLRSDASHLTGTQLMVPALVVMTATAAPRLLGAERRVPLAVAGAALTVASFLLLPHGEFAPASVRSWAAAPLLDRQRLAAGPAFEQAGNAGRPASRRGTRRRFPLLSGVVCADAGIRAADAADPRDRRQPRGLRRQFPGPVSRSRLLLCRPQPRSGLVRPVQQHRDRARTDVVPRGLPHTGAAANPGGPHGLARNAGSQVLPAAVSDRPPDSTALRRPALLPTAPPEIATRHRASHRAPVRPAYFLAARATFAPPRRLSTWTQWTLIPARQGGITGRQARMPRVP